jgi:hypothetical protein
MKVESPFLILSLNLTQSSPDRRGENQGGCKKLKMLFHFGELALPQ